jgi:hypothetical protein
MGVHATGARVEPEWRRPAKGHVMTWSDAVAWAVPALSFIGMSAIPVVLNLAVTGWDLSRVSWVAWGLSVWLFMMAIGGIWEAIADSDGPSHEQDRRDYTRM